jgi:hypothetical protein
MCGFSPPPTLKKAIASECGYDGSLISKFPSIETDYRLVNLVVPLSYVSMEGDKRYSGLLIEMIV